MTGVTRRRVLTGLAFTGAAIAVGIRPVLDRLDGRDRNAVPVDDALRRIGERHLRANQDLELTDVRAALGDPAPDADPAELLEDRAGSIRDDFEDGAVTTVDGWVLAPTEVSIAALQALQAVP